MIPVSIVTGFLGSGKTTLISRMLHDPRFRRTAVVINEFGEIGLDHDLIARSNDTILTLSTGCLCCVVQTDLAETLLALADRRKQGIIDYDRVLIETSGLSDPAPILQALMTDIDVCGVYKPPFVVTLVDTIHGVATLCEHLEARHQIAFADRVLISKTDLQPVPDRLTDLLNGLNQHAPRRATGSAAPHDLFGSTSTVRLPESRPADGRQDRHADILALYVIRDRPLPAVALTLFMQAVVEHCGMRLLRLKGLVAIEEVPDRPALVHGVRHVVSPPDFLERWPTVDRRTRLIFITKDVPSYFIGRLLDAIEDDVREESDHVRG